MCSRSLFSTAAHFHLALLVAASISHFITAATIFFKISVALFLLELRWPATHFLFSLSFSCSIFEICEHDNLSKLNTLDNTDTQKISAFRFRLY